MAPNWRTSYRLKCSALVAVMRLGASYEPLPPDRALQWAEIVPVAVGPKAPPDDTCRQRGRMALQLLGCTGRQGALQQCARTPLEEGLRVAVVDLRVFVPEVLPVLSTLADPALRGHLNEIPFVERLLGVPVPLFGGPERKDERRAAPGPGESCKAAVADAVGRSEIELIRRLPAEARIELGCKLGTLATDANLYGTQLAAFCKGLLCSAHCTQGPPGTGKRHPVKHTD
ncbi:hypothetical protein CYMTET_6520 [Cymbomonas tetramitiformis]|uniref:Uncharacterized protein n=1 Tax=Cymbomonas tetramitiformis TaxID=36881 RepID=A0AAE0LHY1_9CHLO|nr:hypothetical protein CYMTET_6520 [Cymbomonas tetramitiformis]